MLQLGEEAMKIKEQQEERKKLKSQEEASTIKVSCYFPKGNLAVSESLIGCRC